MPYITLSALWTWGDNARPPFDLKSVQRRLKQSQFAIQTHVKGWGFQTVSKQNSNNVLPFETLSWRMANDSILRWKLQTPGKSESKSRTSKFLETFQWKVVEIDFLAKQSRQDGQLSSPIGWIGNEFNLLSGTSEFVKGRRRSKRVLMKCRESGSESSKTLVKRLLIDLTKV